MKDKKQIQGPNFMIVGAARSGTGTLCHYLDRHPGIYLSKPLKPEPTFFVYPEEYKKGIDYYLTARYGGEDSQKARGEKSTKYMTEKGVAKRIHTHFPDMKLIFLLRDPVERAFSNYWWSVKNGVEDLSLEEAMFHEEQRIRKYKGKWRFVAPHSYKRRGFYVQFIREYLRLFPKKSMLFLITEEMIKNPPPVINETFDFLGVPRMKKFPRVRCNEALRHKRPSEELIRYLVDLYRHSNRELEEFLGRKIDCWLK